MKDVSLSDITIRTELRVGDIGTIINRHGVLYHEEYGWGIGFESYVAAGLHEFYKEYDAQKDRIWLCEHEGKFVGCTLVKSRGDAAQLRYFLIETEYRGIGLGGKLFGLMMDFVRSSGYNSAYLWTTSELLAGAHLYRKFGFEIAEEKPGDSFGKPVIEQKYEMNKL
jgi:peptidyl-dipeptidase Dcp